MQLAAYTVVEMLYACMYITGFAFFIICYQKLVEQYENRYIVQEEKISQLESAATQSNEKLGSLEKEKETLIQSIEKLSTEVARLMTVENNLHCVKDIERCELCKRQKKLQTKV